jgi:nicotinamidase-related amidase
MMRPWEAIFGDTDREVLHKGGFGKRQEFGKSPTLLLIDIKTSFIGTTRKPILEAVEEFSTSCGEAGWDSARLTEKLLKASRANGVRVVHVTGDPHYRQFTSSSVKGTPPGTFSTPELEEFFPAVAPRSTELVIRKTKASAFFGTPLAGCLRDIGTDTLLIGGCTTSGCVRASVVDAYNEGFKCFVVEECVFDRFPPSHLVNLWDLNAKYADVITLDEALEYVSTFAKTQG